MTGTPVRLGRASQRARGAVSARVDPLRLAALAGTLGLIFSYLAVLSDIVTVTGDPRALGAVAGVALVAATVFARLVRLRHALVVGVLALSAGMGLYFYTVGLELAAGALVDSVLQLTTGGSALQIRDSTLWALAMTPAPVFLTWYLALRRQYGTAVVASGFVLAFFVLTGDAGTTITLVGVAGGAAALGFGDLDRDAGTATAASYVFVVLAIMVIAPLLVTVVPGGAASPISLAETTGGGGGNLESSVVDADEELSVLGSISLSPEVRFTVEADRAQYWRTASYARYTGDGWVQVGEAGGADGGGTLRPPPGPNYRLSQTVRAEDRLEAMPAAWRPVAVREDWAGRVDLERGEQLSPREPIPAGDTYEVVSAVPDPSADRLARAGTDYPEAIESLYTQLPSDTPDRVHEATDGVVADAETPYEKAVAIEHYLEAEKDYSLDVDRPDGSVADAFLFEMDAGYCTYFATTMVTMLRSEGVPARMAVGYSAGQQVDEGRWVVRGSNAHAWVEVYFPEVGWVEFDPTPGDERRSTAQSALSDARDEGAESVDTEESAGVPPSGPLSGIAQNATPRLNPELGPEYDPIRNQGNATPGGLPERGSLPGDGGGDSGGLGLPALPSTRELALGALVIVGAVAGLSRSRSVRRFRKRLRARYQRRSDPATDVEGAFRRLAILLELRHRPRRSGETVREYLAAIDPDPRAHRVAMIRERLRYDGDVSADLADEAVELVDALRTEGVDGPAALEAAVPAEGGDDAPR